MPDLIAAIAQPILGAAKTVFSYAASNRSAGGRMSASTTSFLYNVTPQQVLAAGANNAGLNFPHATTAPDLGSSSLFIIALNWLITHFCDAQPVVEKWEKPDGLNPRWVPDYEHPAVRLLRSPDDLLTSEQMWSGVLTDIAFDANSYVAKPKNLLGEPMALHWSPWWQWKIVTTPEDAAAGIAISWYERTTGTGNKKNVEKWYPDEVIHFRGTKVDPNDSRRGWNDSAAFFSEFNSDFQRARITNAVLRNNAAVTGIVSLEDPDDSWEEGEAARLQNEWNAQHGGDNTGGLHFATGRIKFDKTMMSPAELLLDQLARIPETRVAGWFLIPPGVLSFLTGLERNTDSNLERSEEAALESAVIPLWRRYGAQLSKDLLSEPVYGHRRKRGLKPDGTILYGPMTWKVRVGWDTSEVRALQDDRFASDKNAVEKWRWGLATFNEARAEVNLKPVEDERGGWVYSDFLAHSAGVAGSGNQPTGGGKPANASGGGTADDAQGNKDAGMNDGGNPASAAKTLTVSMVDLMPAMNANGNAH